MDHTEVKLLLSQTFFKKYPQRAAGLIPVCPQAKIVDPVTGQTVPLGTSGELMIRGYCVMKGYWNDPVKTSEAITDGQWYKTGCVQTQMNGSLERTEGF